MAARRALEAIGILGPRTPEIDEVWDHLRVLSAPILSDEPARIEPEMAARLGLDPAPRPSRRCASSACPP